MRSEHERRLVASEFDPTIIPLNMDMAKSMLNRRINSYVDQGLVYTRPDGKSFIFPHVNDSMHKGYSVIEKPAREVMMEIISEYGCDPENFTQLPDTFPTEEALRQTIEFRSRTIPGLVFHESEDFDINSATSKGNKILSVHHEIPKHR